MKKSTNKDVYMVEFNSISELTKYCKTEPTNTNLWKSVRDLSSKDNSEYRSRFTLTNSFEHAEQLLTNGWSEGSVKLNKGLKIANSKQQDKEVQRAIYDIVGFQASVPRYIQGIPTNMVNQKMVKRKQRTINLYKSVAYSASVKAERIMEDSIKFLQIIQEIEKKGIRVNAYVIFHTISRREQLLCITKIKDAGERLNVSKMSFPLMHPSFLRRFLFRVTECDSRLTERDWSDTYGRPVPNEATKKLINKDDFIIPILITESEAIDILSKLD